MGNFKAAKELIRKLVNLINNYLKSNKIVLKLIPKRHLVLKLKRAIKIKRNKIKIL